MAGLFQRFYLHAPYPVQCWIAGFYGRKHSKLRYGPEYQRAIQEIKKRNKWTRGQFEQFQLEKLQCLVQHCSRHVPYYRELLANANVTPESIQSLDDIRRIPVTNKETLRQRTTDFLDERIDTSSLIKFHTSGTTGTPLTLYRNTQENSIAFAYHAVRFYGVCSVKRCEDRSILVSGNHVCRPNRTRPPYWVENRHWNMLTLSSFHLSEQTMPDYIDAVREYSPDYIEGYPSSIYPIAEYILRKKLDPIPMKGAFVTAENLYPHQRDAIEKAFQCKLINQYGCGEQVVYAAECPYGSMHLSLDHSIVEFLDDDGNPVPPGQSGHIVGTNLTNFTQPFLRYRIGDNGVLADPSTTCPCGSTFPVLAQIDGREDDVLILRNGKLIRRLMAIYKGIPGVREAQIIQNTLDNFLIRIVNDERFTEEQGKLIIQRMHDRLGSEVQVNIEIVPDIARTSRGKFRPIICKLSEEEKSTVLNQQ